MSAGRYKKGENKKTRVIYNCFQLHHIFMIITKAILKKCKKQGTMYKTRTKFVILEEGA